MTHPDFQLFDPMRRPDWRFQRALTLFEAGQTPRRPGRWDDRQVRWRYKFLRVLRDADPAAVAEVEGRAGRRVDAAALEKYFAKCAGIWYAFRIYTNNERAWRWMVQAALVAREDDAHIAHRLGTLPPLTTEFEHPTGRDAVLPRYRVVAHPSIEVRQHSLPQIA